MFVSKVGPGDYDERAAGGFSSPQTGHYCAYLYKKGAKASDKPLLTSSKAFTVPAGVPTQVGYQQGTPYYHGKLQSPKAACLKGRTVTLYGKRPGKPDRAESHATSAADGSWRVPLPLEDTSDDTAAYFAVSAASPQGVSFTCRAARTKDFPLSGN